MRFPTTPHLLLSNPTEKEGKEEKNYSHFTEEETEAQEFPGSPVVRTQSFHCWGPGSIPGQGTKILPAV